MAGRGEQLNVLRHQSFRRSIYRNQHLPSFVRTIWRHAALEQPFEIVVRYPHHPFAGKRITVVRSRTYAHQSYFVVDAPDNYRILLLAWMTEPWAATLPLLESRDCRLTHFGRSAARLMLIGHHRRPQRVG